MSNQRVAKRILSCLFILSLLLAVSACGNSNGSGQNGGEAAAASTQTSGTASNAEKAGGEAALLSPEQAVQKLKDGNGRFVSEDYAREDIGSIRRQELTAGQHPFAVIVACSDSRVPPELVFDQGLGDIFVVRVAGNVIDADALGSVEYAVEHLHSPLVMVMGHQECGAVKAAIEGGPAPAGITAILQKIAPSVDSARAAGLSGAGLLDGAVRDNIKTSVSALEASPVLEEKLVQGELKIVSGEYMLGNGVVADL